jgi:hypothetical protein
MEHYLMDVWPGVSGGNLEEVALWGIQPLEHLNELFDEEIEGEDNPRYDFIHYEFKSKLMSLDAVLHRFDIYQMMLENRLKELAPDDPLVTDPVETLKKELARREEISKKHKQEMAERKSAKLERAENNLKLHVILNDILEKMKGNGAPEAEIQTILARIGG